MIHILCKISFKEWKLFGLAIFLTGFARILSSTMKLKKFSFLLGTYMQESSIETDTNHIKALQAVSLAIRRAGRIVPWRCLCNEKAIAGKIMLNGKKIPSTLYYGVSKDSSNNMKAHAWLRSGNLIVTGKPAMGKFTILGTFA